MLLNIALTGEPKVPLHFQLHRNAMTIPAGPSRYPVTLHCHVPGENVLEYPGLDMMHAWAAVRGRRPVVEPEQLAIPVLLQRLPDNLPVVPARQDPLFDRWHFWILIARLEHRRLPPLCAPGERASFLKRAFQNT